MSETLTHATNLYGCRIRYSMNNQAARVEYPEASGKAAEEFASEPLVFERREHDDGSHENVAVAGEPTATMQAIHAAKKFAAESQAAAARAEADKVAAAVAKAKAKAAAASTPQPKR